MSRSENIAVVESYLSGLARKDLSSVPFAPGITFEGPLMPKLAGRETIVAFLTSTVTVQIGLFDSGNISGRRGERSSIQGWFCDG